LKENRDELNAEIAAKKRELADNLSKIRTAENEMLNMEAEFKSAKKALVETEERVQKEMDRKKKILEQLDHRKKNYENSISDAEKKKRAILDLEEFITGKEANLDERTKENNHFKDQIR